MEVPFLSLRDVTLKYREEIHEAALRVIDSGWYLQGQENRTFEKDWAEYCGARYCVGCANGLDALIWILRGYKEMGMLHEGDEVIVPANTYIASVLSITENNLRAVLVEPKAETLEIDDDRIEQALTPKTKAIMIVHLYGRNAYTDKIGQLCKKHNLLLIQDCAQSHGLKVSTRDDLESACAHSFYPGKNLGALGDGGAVTTNNEALADVIRSLANYGSQKKYVFKYCGRNSRLDEIQAAILDVKLRHLDEDVRRRQEVAAYYYDNISSPIVELPVRLSDKDNVYHLFPILVKGEGNRNLLQQYLADNGIGTVIHYPIPPHQQECYAGSQELRISGTQEHSLPVTESLAREELSLPMSPCLTREQVEWVVEQVNEFHQMA